MRSAVLVRRGQSLASSATRLRRPTPCHAIAATVSHVQALSTSSSVVPAAADNNTSSLVPVDFDASSKISGEESQIVEITLQPNQVIRAESGAMLYMTKGIQMETSLGGGNSGMSAGFKRMLTGQNLMVSDFSYQGEASGTVALGTDFPSKIMRFSLPDYGHKIVCQKSAFLAGSHTVDIELEFAKKFTTGFFGGEGFVLQSLTGKGDVFVKAGGTLVERELKPGETLRISSGCLVAFTQDVQYDVQMMEGFKNVLFGGEGLFVTTLTGPGKVWLQGMPPDRMISEVVRRIGPAGRGLGVPIPIGGSGGASGEAEDVAEGADDAAGGGEEDMVAATDAAVDADRNATVASSGLGGASDADSPDALFGDAAAAPDPTEASPTEDNAFGDFQDTTQMDDASTFSTNDEPMDTTQFDDFEQDQTSFSSFESSDSGSSEQVDFGGSDDMGGGDEGGGIGGIIRTIWDMFMDDE